MIRVGQKFSICSNDPKLQSSETILFLSKPPQFELDSEAALTRSLVKLVKVSLKVQASKKENYGIGWIIHMFILTTSYWLTHDMSEMSHVP